MRIASVTPHHGEEPVLSGTGGSGTVFFSGCNLRCRFCQNFQISHFGQGRYTNVHELADIFISLQKRGCHNINLVSPTHYAPSIAAALSRAKSSGLHIPVVYNTNGYDSVETLKSLDGLVDIYLPDMKYGDNGPALKYSGAVEYVKFNQMAVIEMHRQVGRLRTGPEGIAEKGLMIRHLVLPGGLAGSFKVLDFLADNGFHRVPLSIMSQYHPLHHAASYPELNRKITEREYTEVTDYAEKLGFSDILTQEAESSETYLPDFTRDEPFAGSR